MSDLGMPVQRIQTLCTHTMRAQCSQCMHSGIHSLRLHTRRQSTNKCKLTKEHQTNNLKHCRSTVEAQIGSLLMWTSLHTCTTFQSAYSLTSKVAVAMFMRSHSAPEGHSLSPKMHKTEMKTCGGEITKSNACTCHSTNTWNQHKHRNHPKIMHALHKLK